MATSLLGLFLSSSFSSSYFVFKVTIAFYTTFGVEHLLLSGQLVLFLQLQP